MKSSGGIALSGSSVELRPDPDLLRPVDIPVLRGDCRRLQLATGWEPTIDLDTTLAGIDEEVTRLRINFATLATDAWASMVTLDGEEIDPHWIARHAVHDPTHHLLDIERLRNAL